MIAAFLTDKCVGGIEQGPKVEPPGLAQGDGGLASVQPVFEESLFLLRGQFSIERSHYPFVFVCGELLVTGSTWQETIF